MPLRRYDRMRADARRERGYPVGVLQRFENRLEGMVEGAFARAFKSELQPVEIASAVQREMDDRAAIVAQGRTLVPNDFVVELAAGPARLGRGARGRRGPRRRAHCDRGCRRIASVPLNLALSSSVHPII